MNTGCMVETAPLSKARKSHLCEVRHTVIFNPGCAEEVKVKYVFIVQYTRTSELIRYALPAQRTFTITFLSQTCYTPAPSSTPRGVYSPCYRKQRKGLLSNTAFLSCQILGYD